MASLGKDGNPGSEGNLGIPGNAGSPGIFGIPSLGSKIANPGMASLGNAGSEGRDGNFGSEGSSGIAGNANAGGNACLCGVLSLKGSVLMIMESVLVERVEE